MTVQMTDELYRKLFDARIYRKLTVPRVRVATDVSVRPFNERFVDCIDAYRYLDISRWNVLTSAAAKLRPLERKQEDGLTVYQLDVDSDKLVDSDELVCYVMDDLLDFYNIAWLTKQEVDNFWFLVERAREKFELVDRLTAPGVLQHDSSAESVIEELPQCRTRSIGCSYVKTLVEGYIRLLKRWEATKLSYDYKLFLAECDWITDGTCTISGLKMLHEDPTFMERGFHMIPSYELQCGFNDYILILCLRGGAKEAKAHYKNKICEEFKRAELSFEKDFKRFPADFTHPIYFLVFKEREEKYIIEHPVVEIAKIRAYFGDISLDDYQYEGQYRLCDGE